MHTDIIKQHIPNWTRFCIGYEPDIEFIEAFEARMAFISETPEFQNIAKKINVELGVLLLRHNEIDSETLQFMIGSLVGMREEHKKHEPLFDESIFKKSEKQD